MKSFPLDFGDMLAALVSLHSVDPGKVRAFESRIKNLQRLNFLPDLNTGRGRKAAYGIEQAILLSLAIELLQLGATPERVIGIISPRRQLVLQELKAAARGGGLIRGRPKLMYFDPRALADLQNEDAMSASGVSVNNVRFGAGRDLGQFFGSHRHAPPRLAVIDLQLVVADLVVSVSSVKEVSERDLIEEIVEWGCE